MTHSPLLENAASQSDGLVLSFPSFFFLVFENSALNNCNPLFWSIFEDADCLKYVLHISVYKK